MIEIIGVNFKKAGKIYYFAPDNQTYKKNDDVVVETARGIEIGKVVIPNKHVSEEEIVPPLRSVIRRAGVKDIKKAQENELKAQEAFKVCQKKIIEHKLAMKLIDVEISLDNSKILFYFTSDGRVDFRELVKDLASIFRIRIELRQIGVRDQAKIMGGLGICGKPFCCHSFLNDFQPVSIKMAKEQNISLNPTKISGMCGRLMCCLNYEQEAYEELIKITPGVGSVVKTADGTGKVVDVNLIKGELRVALDKENELVPNKYSLKEVQVIRKKDIVIDDSTELPAEDSDL